MTAIKTLARYEPDTVYIGTGEYVAECVRSDDGDYYLAADVDAAIEALQAEIERLAAQLTAAQQRPVEDGCHCGTCTCSPNMTPAVRFDLSPAQQEGAIREHLIRLGWTPPDKAEALRAEVERLREALDDIRSRSVTDLVMRSDPAVQGEPVAYIRQEDFEFILADDKSEPYGTRQAPVFSRTDCRDPVPLYASPQPPAQAREIEEATCSISSSL